MSFSFDPDGRRWLAERCAAFTRSAAEADPALKRAAVAITIVEAAPGSGEAAFLLTRRAASLRSHGGQWALPGGRCDPGETPSEAALRELHEELGLPLGPADVMGVLDDYPTRSGYLIAPVVVWGGNTDAIVPNPAEVASVHRIALTEILRPDAISFTRIPESDRQVVRLALRGGHIHAPTAALIYQFGELVAGRQTRVAELEQPLFAWR